MDVTEVAVEFRKTVSDGDYGNETYSVRLTASKEEGERSVEVAQELAELAHGVVWDRLRGSTSERIRLALETPEEREARRQQERAARDAERERWRQEAEAEWAAARAEDETAEDEAPEEEG